MKLEEIPQTAKTAGDFVAYGAAFGSLANLLPSIAAGLSIIWLTIQITQSKPFRQFAGLFCRAAKWAFTRKK